MFIQLYLILPLSTFILLIILFLPIDCVAPTIEHEMKIKM
jgi:hypothetical protein